MTEAIQKNKTVCTEDHSGCPEEGELALINRYTRRSFSAEDVYVFPLVLCDNEIDRDFERFSDASLEKMAELFVGVTGIADHNPTSSNQTARIFSCHTETVDGRFNRLGEPYKRLCARAYLPRSENSSDWILALDSGIKKEVSVGCAVRKRICSICGRDTAECSHIKGREYGGKLCYALLDEVTDAYEWSFVAVPAQKNAGVTKAYGSTPTSDDRNTPYKRSQKTINMDIEKKLTSGQEQSFSADEMMQITQKIASLEERAREGDFYKAKAASEIRRLAAAAFPSLDEGVLSAMMKGLSARELDELRKAFESKAEEVFPMKPQLYRESSKNKGDNTLYQ